MSGHFEATARYELAAKKRAIMLLAAVPVDMADSCILEAIEAVKGRADISPDVVYDLDKAKRFAKRAMAAAMAAAGGREIKGDRMMEYFDQRAEAIRHDLFVLRIQLKQYMDTRSMTDTDTKSRVWLACEAAQFCRIEHAKIAETAAENYGIKVKQDLLPLSMAGAEAALEAACKLILEPEWKDEYDPANEPVLVNAVVALHNRLFTEDNAVNELFNCVRPNG